MAIGEMSPMRVLRASCGFVVELWGVGAEDQERNTETVKWQTQLRLSF